MNFIVDGKSVELDFVCLQELISDMLRDNQDAETVKEAVLEGIHLQMKEAGVSDSAFESFKSKIKKGDLLPQIFESFRKHGKIIINSPVEKDFLKTPLHITWMNETMAYIEKMVMSNKALKPLFDEMIAIGSVKGRVPRGPAEADLLAGLNLIFSAKNAQEVVIRDKGETFGIDPNWDLKASFNPIFEDMIINLHYKNEGYMASFMQLFKIDEDYIDPSTGEASPVYIAKTMVKAKNVVTTGIPSNYKAVFEAILIKSKLPRVLFPSYISDVCRNCTMATETNMMVNVYGSANEGVRYCLRTPRNYHNCRVVDLADPYPPNSSPTFSEIGFANIKIITDVLEKLNKPAEHITKVSIEKVKREYDFKEKNRYLNHDDRSYIEIKDVVVDIVRPDAEPIPREHRGGTHASPVEHIRRPSVRHLKSGKVVPVKGSIVNPGGKKPIYVVKG